MRAILSRGISIIFVIVLALSACKPDTTISPAPTTPLPNLISPVPATAIATLPPQPTGTPARSLVICLGQEPQSLYLYGSSSRGMWSVLEALYDGPIDIRKFSPQPVILQKLPVYPDQDIAVESVDVKAGELVVDANGDLINLAANSRILPAGCTGTDCAIGWDGNKALKMDRLKLTFRLLPGLKWSDGTPLTAADSVYSFNLASDPATKVSKRVTDRTATYQAGDNDLTVEWTGRPGYAPQRLDGVFFTPLPKHAWETYKPAQMETIEAVARKPIGWGPYIIQEWKAGDHIRLTKNPNYFRASEGLPKFDTLVYRFLGEPGDNNLAALQSGECDVVDQTTLLEDQLKSIIDLQNEKKLKAYTGQGPEWEHLDFGIRPAAYDDGINPAKDRPDFFGDVRVRQAIAECIDRSAIVQNLLYNRSIVPASYLPPEHPLFSKDLKPLAYDPAAANQLLTEAGWKDPDNNPATPRIAQGIPNVPNGTPFVVTYVTSEATIRTKTAESIKQNLAGCGIGVKVTSLNPGQLYAAGPAGSLFGRNFDLAQFSWDTGSQPPCALFETGSIPTAKNSWIGGNLTGYSSPAFDAACKTARQSRPDSAGYTTANQAAVRILAKDLPFLPLYFPLKIAISRPDFCNLEMDVSARSFLWNLESYDVSPACKP